MAAQSNKPTLRRFFLLTPPFFSPFTERERERRTTHSPSKALTLRNQLHIRSNPFTRRVPTPPSPPLQPSMHIISPLLLPPRMHARAPPFPCLFVRLNAPSPRRTAATSANQPTPSAPSACLPACLPRLSVIATATQRHRVAWRGVARRVATGTTSNGATTTR